MWCGVTSGRSGYSAGLKKQTNRKTKERKKKEKRKKKKERLRVVHVVKGSEYGTFGPRW